MTDLELVLPFTLHLLHPDLHVHVRRPKRFPNPIHISSQYCMRIYNCTCASQHVLFDVGCVFDSCELTSFLIPYDNFILFNCSLILLQIYLAQLREESVM